jgi:RHS repeat-associated protein
MSCAPAPRSASSASNYSPFGFRWYNPVTAFFATQDTSSYLASPANGNRYAYAADNPTNNIDPTGADWLGCAGAILGTASAVGGLIALSGCLVNVRYPTLLTVAVRLAAGKRIGS